MEVEEDEEKDIIMNYNAAFYSNPNVEFFVNSPSDRYLSDQNMSKIIEDDDM